MEGICFEVKARDDPIKDHPLSALTQTLPGSADKRKKEEGEEEIKYRLTLVGSLAIHPQTTMTMLPWVVAEIRRPRPGEKNGNHEFNGTCSPEVSLFIHVGEKIHLTEKHSNVKPNCIVSVFLMLTIKHSKTFVFYFNIF